MNWQVGKFWVHSCSVTKWYRTEIFLLFHPGTRTAAPDAQPAAIKGASPLNFNSVFVRLTLRIWGQFNSGAFGAWRRTGDWGGTA